MHTQKYINQLAFEIVGCAIEVHKELGPGLLESIYEACLIEELTSEGFEFRSQVEVPVFYKSKKLSQNFRVDIVVENLIILELKAVEVILPLHKAQVLTYMNLLKMPKGLLINFNSANISNTGLTPLVNKFFENLPKE